MAHDGCDRGRKIGTAWEGGSRDNVGRLGRETDMQQQQRRSKDGRPR